MKPHPPSSAEWRFVLVASVFLGCFSAGVAMTRTIADHAVRDLPRAEVFEALYRDGVAARWSCAGYLITIGISALAATAAARCSKREQAAQHDA